MRPQISTAELRCYSTPTSYQRYSFTMPSRGTPVSKEEGFEARGVVLLVLCGLYAVFLFVAARILSGVASSVMSSVKSVCWKVDITDVSPESEQTELTETDKGSHYKMKFQRLQPRTISHGWKCQNCWFHHKITRTQRKSTLFYVIRKVVCEHFLYGCDRTADRWRQWIETCKIRKEFESGSIVLLLLPLVIAIVELNQLDTKQEQGQGQTTYIISITKSSQMIFRSLMHWCMASDSVVSSCVINMQTCRQIYGIELPWSTYHARSGVCPDIELFVKWSW